MHNVSLCTTDKDCSSSICPLKWNHLMRSTLSRSGASACRTSLWPVIFAFIDKPRSWQYPISCLHTVEGKASQQALHCHSHTEASVPWTAAWMCNCLSCCTEIVWERCSDLCSSSAACRQICCWESDIPHSGCARCTEADLLFSPWPVTVAHGRLLMESGLTRAQLCDVKNSVYKFQAAKIKNGNVTDGFITWLPEELKFWGSLCFLFFGQAAGRL